MNISTLTDHPEVRKAWHCPDGELKTMVDVLPKVPMTMRDDWASCISHHRDYIESGLVNIPWCYQEILQSLDPYLRFRWDMQCQCYVIERVDTGLRAWVRLFRWADADGKAKLLSDVTAMEIVEKLKSHDMQRYSPAEYLAMKRLAAEKVKLDIHKTQVDELLDAVDRMTDRQIDEFIAVERAMVTGETIRPGGDDAKKLNKWHEMTVSGKR